MSSAIIRSSYVYYADLDNLNDLTTSLRRISFAPTFFWHRNDEISRELNINLTNARRIENR